MFNRELFRKQLECAVHRAQKRNIALSTRNRFGINYDAIANKTGKIVLTNPTYILAMFLEGHKLKQYMDGYLHNDEHKQCAELLRCSRALLQNFSNGHCSREYNAILFQDNYSDLEYAHNLLLSEDPEMIQHVDEVLENWFSGGRK